MMELTIGMATYDDFDGVYFTLQALRLYQNLQDVEVVVVDNFGCPATRDLVENCARGRYILSTETVGTAAPRDRIFREARGEAVLCLDCHVLLQPGAIARLKRYYRDHPDSFDLLQGPVLHDDLVTLASHFEPVWRDQMWGIWALDQRAVDPEAEPFEIPMQGLGLLSCQRQAWPGFNPRFRGFGGEEGYLHQKFRNLGRRCWCLPWLRWLHRFHRRVVRSPVNLHDKIHNYLVGHDEVGLDLQPVIEHFQRYAPRPMLEQIIQDSLGQRVAITAQEEPVSNLGKWDPWFEGVRDHRPFGDVQSYEKAARFLEDQQLVEDWGCGLAWFKQLIGPGRYRGVDGSKSAFADIITDLTDYTSSPDGILMRHVLEHNHSWEKVLCNALGSFRRKMCLIFFTPFHEATGFTHEQQMAPGKSVPYYRFAKADITRHFEGVCRWTEETLGNETLFYLEK
jgi:hypothetical protein